MNSSNGQASLHVQRKRCNINLSKRHEWEQAWRSNTDLTSAGQGPGSAQLSCWGVMWRTIKSRDNPNRSNDTMHGAQEAANRASKVRSFFSRVSASTLKICSKRFTGCKKQSKLYKTKMLEQLGNFPAIKIKTDYRNTFT